MDHGDKTVAELIKDLDSKDQLLRDEAVFGLGKAGEKHELPDPDIAAVVKQLAQILQKDSQPGIRRNAAQALGNFGEKALDTLPALIQAAQKDKDTWVREESIVAIGFISASTSDQRALIPLRDLLMKDPNAQIRAEAANALGSLRGVDAVPTLQERLKKDDDSHVRQESAKALGRMQKAAEPAVAELVHAIHDPEDIVGMAAVEALGHIRSKNAISALLGALSDKNPDIREFAIYALGRTGEDHPEVVHELAKAIAADKDADFGLYVTKALGAVRTETAVKPLLEIAQKHDAGPVRANAILHLGEFFLGHGETDAEEVVAVLKDLLGDKDFSLAKIANEALEKIKRGQTDSYKPRPKKKG
jgi:HEAT repeat protein